MTVTFYISAAIAVLSTLLAITRLNAVHGLLYLIVSLLSMAVVFYTLGAHFIAALEIVIYAGAIMVLFLFVVMMLNLGSHAVEREREWVSIETWWGPAILSALLLIELVFAMVSNKQAAPSTMISPKQVGMALFGPYLLGVELASMLLLAGLVSANHVGRRDQELDERGGG